MSVPTSHEFSSLWTSESVTLSRQFTFSEIQQATKNLDDSFVIGRGGFGKVYKGTITNGRKISTVAIKRLDLTSNQGASEFWAEVYMLSNLRHCHLVSLIGYCNDGQEMILVYEYMSNGTLEDHLHKRQTPLSWVQRLTICIGASRGLDYLHTGTGIKHGVVHRDVKSSNILLHGTWEAKISDFGLSKICPKNQQTTHVNTGVKGTFGYLDPDYFYTGKLTRKSDVYAFGVVLFEVLCGKQAVDRSIDEDQWGLAIWAQESIKQGRLKQIVDTNIREEISPKCLKLFAQLAKQCLCKHLKQRPTMAAIVAGLESILALQEKANNTLEPITMNFFARKEPKVISALPKVKRKIRFLSNDKDIGEKIKSFELYVDTVGGENQTLVRFDFDVISVAVDNFSEAYKISQHTSDALYKGKLQNGQIITVSEPSYGIRHTEYSMNEASILVKLEHQNVAKLLGYCIEGTRLFLVYDFPLHAILDHLMFDPECTILNWDKRYKMILDVAKALLYLHRDAPMRVIHCDVKPGNILLDESLSPILSSFWTARCLAINETICDVSKVNGTWIYMAPEYMQNGALSTKVDVYSLGVLVLEFITGRRAITDMLEYVERNWLEEKISNIIDPRIDVDSSSLIRFVEIGLSCVQTDPLDRPTMDEVVSMLRNRASLTPPMEKMKAIMQDSIRRNCCCMDITSLGPPAAKIQATLQTVIRREFSSLTLPAEKMPTMPSIFLICPMHDYDTTAVEDFISDLRPR